MNSANSSRRPFWVTMTVASAALLAHLAARHFGWSLLPDAWGSLELATGNAGLLAIWAIGHCDGMDGPVVTLARKALESGNVNLILPWVAEQDEDEIRRAFGHAVAVRKLGPEAQSLADRHFFETLVRVHRAGEGESFTGLKPAGRDLGPAIPAADKALESGSAEAVVDLLTHAIREGVQQRFHAAFERKRFPQDDVKAGRAYVEAYVPYVHYVEQLWQTTRGGGASGHGGAHHAHGH